MNNSEEKTEVQRFFDVIRSYDVDIDFGLIEDIFSNKKDIRDTFAKYLIKEIEDHIKNDDTDILIKKSFFIGNEPEPPTNGSDYAFLQIKTTFLKELETGGLLETLEFSSTGDEPFQRYAQTTFYPFKLLKYLKENKGSTHFGKKSEEFYITRYGEDFRYKNSLLSIGKSSDAYVVFSVLYDLLPEGGYVVYEKITAEVKNRISKTKDFTKPKIQKFILDNLGEHNGFIHQTGIDPIVNGGKKLIAVKRGKGIEFNNKRNS